MTESGMSYLPGFSAKSRGSAPTATRCSARSPTTLLLGVTLTTSWRSRTWRACCAPLQPRPCVTALRERFDLPVHLHCHDTPGGQLATLLAAIDEGDDAVDAAMSGTTSQPSLSSQVAATD